MRYAIFSDIHSNLEALEAVLAAYHTERIDTYLCVGDVVGYAANPNECIQRINAVSCVTVAGNHDWAAVGTFSTADFNPEAQEAVAWTKQHLTVTGRTFLESLQLVYETEDLVIVHGSLDDPGQFNYLLSIRNCARSFELMKQQVCFVGHTHVPVVFVKEPHGTLTYRDVDDITIEPEKKYIVNVGSVGQPRDSIPHAACCIFDTETNTVQIKRIQYDVFTARRKIVEAGLPHFLGDRLLIGN